MHKPKASDVSSITAEIDAVDSEVLSLVQRRSQLVQDLFRSSNGGIVGRVADAAARIDSLVDADGEATGLSPESKAELLKHISSVCLQQLHTTRAAFLGPVHSYSHLAAIKYFGDGIALSSVASIPAVFDAVLRGDAATGIVPIENSTDGRVVDTLGMFVRREMQICGEVLLPIHHCLLSTTPRNEIVEVHSKPQALSQCRKWLASQLPQARLIEIGSTAAAAELAAKKKGVAAVASLQAGRAYGLDVIDENIEDNPNNVTRFAVLGREQRPATGDDKTALLLQVTHQPGALADVMNIFKNESLNLTWIESFPAIDKPSEYLFFIELTGHRTDAGVTKALATLEEQTERLDVLGSYPRARL
tara:strand:- start:13166 stop:14248 length:1083 start_codon:yes stop_codon:yes gene_type:complete